ncbi:MAG: adenosylcobinamide-GDP ribazoletransferase [Candidatus Kapaibacterium sp.]|nr:MAG: adenosylcobinamide-GDP ribazoletransferase [Candidatus Kapabacteria bacterium]
MHSLRREIRLFFTAVMFFTRIPCPAWVDHSEEYLHHSSRYFPLMGWIVGGAGASVLLVSAFVVPKIIAILLSVIATVLLTGAFHEDGFADACDGFGGGWTKERILAIMQDSRLGTFGTIGLVGILALKVACLLVIAESYSTLSACFLMVAAHAASRFTAVSFLMTHEYARSEGESKAKPLATRMTTGEFTTALLTGLLPFLLLFSTFGGALILFIFPLLLVKWYLARFFTRWIQGYTGDCLGATQQVAEVACYLMFLVMKSENVQELFWRAMEMMGK